MFDTASLIKRTADGRPQTGYESGSPSGWGNIPTGACRSMKSLLGPGSRARLRHPAPPRVLAGLCSTGWNSFAFPNLYWIG